MILGQGGVVGDGLSGLEDGCDLFESRAALGSHLGRYTSRQIRCRRRSVVLRKSGFGSENFDFSCFGLIDRSRRPLNRFGRLATFFIRTRRERSI